MTLNIKNVVQFLRYEIFAQYAPLKIIRAERIGTEKSPSITGSSLTLAKMLRAEKRKQQAKMHKKKIIDNH